MKKNILVAGGAGFIGINLCYKLIKDGHTVICIDNLYTGSMKNIEKLMSHPNFIFLEEDIKKIGFWEKIHGLNLHIDEIYNLACPASPPAYQRDPMFTIKTSINGAINLLGIAKHFNAKYLQASTSEVYGDPLEHPQKETYNGNVNIIGIRSCYDVSKRMAETICYEYKRMGVDVKIVRISNTFGKFMDKDDGRVISNFICQALENKPITIYGTGLQTRSPCYVKDLINALCKMMESEEFGPINIGNDVEFSIKEIAWMVLDFIPESNSVVVHKDLPQDDPKRRKLDLTRARTLLNYEPQIDFKSGLKKAIEYFREVLRK